MPGFVLWLDEIATVHASPTTLLMQSAERKLQVVQRIWLATMLSWECDTCFLFNA